MARRISALTDEGALRHLLATHEEYVFRGSSHPDEVPDKVAKFEAARDEILRRLRRHALKAEGR